MMHADWKAVTMYKSTRLPVPEDLYLYQHCLRTSNLQMGIHPITVSSTKYREVVRTGASCLGDPRFKYQPKDQLSCLKFMKVYISLSRKIPERKLKLTQNRQPSYSFQLITQLISYHSILYILRHCQHH